MEYILILIVVLLIAAILFGCIRIVPQASAWIIEFLGKYRCTWNAGIHFKIPVLHRIVK